MEVNPPTPWKQSRQTEHKESIPSSPRSKPSGFECPEDVQYTQPTNYKDIQTSRSVHYGQNADYAFDADDLMGGRANVALGDGDLGMEDSDGDLTGGLTDVALEDSDLVMENDHARSMKATQIEFQRTQVALRAWLEIQDSQVVSLKGHRSSASHNPAAHLGLTHYTQQDLAEEKERTLAANAPADPNEVISQAELGWEFLDGGKSDSESNGPFHTAFVIQTAHQLRRLEYARLHDTGLVSMLDFVLPQECLRSKDLHHLDMPILLCDTMLPVLASTEPTVLRHIINGNLARAYYRREEKVYKALQAMLHRPNHQPVIYKQLLVNELGLSPSLKEFMQVIALMRLYCAINQRTDEEIKQLLRIETSFNTISTRWGTKQDVIAGKRKYLVSASSRYTFTPQIS